MVPAQPVSFDRQHSLLTIVHLSVEVPLGFRGVFPGDSPLFGEPLLALDLVGGCFAFGDCLFGSCTGRLLVIEPVAFWGWGWSVHALCVCWLR